MLIENFFPLWLIIALFTAASGIIIFSYFKTSQNISLPYRLLLLGLKLAAVFMLIFAIFQPYLLIRKNIHEKGKLAVLIDVSPSMAVKDSNGITGLNKINSIFSDKSSKLLDELRKNHSIKLYTFSDYLTSLIKEDTYPSFTQTGFRTQLSDALKGISHEMTGNDLNGIILFSDGCDPSLAESLSDEHNFDVPVYSVGIGNEEKIKDIHLMNVEPENIIYLDLDADVSLSIKTSGCQEESTDIILLEEEKEIARQKFFIKKDGLENIKMKFRPLSSGWHRYSVVVVPLSNEQVTINNMAVFYLFVIQGKMKILFIEGTPGLDFKFIKKVLEEDKNLKIDYLVYKNKKEFFNIDRRYLTVFPEKKQLFNYNIIILSSVPYSNLTDKQIILLKDFVEKTGGGFLFLTGENSSGYTGSELEKILPVTFPKEHLFYDNIFNPVLTRDGNIHPVMRFDPDTEKNTKIWNELPGLTGIMAINKIKIGALLLALHPGLKFNSGFLVFMVLQEYGRGRTMVVNAGGLWRWDFLMWGIGDKNAYASKYWTNIMRWLGNKEKKRNFNFEVDKRLCIVGDTLSVRISLFDEKTLMPLTGVNIECKIKDVESKKETSIEIIDSQNNSGIYTGEIKLDNPEEAVIIAKAVYKKNIIGIEHINISVVPSRDEYNNLVLNKNGLKQLADLSDGVYFSPDEINKIPEKIRKNVNTGSYMEKIELWDTFWYFIAFLSILILEWWLRKRKGLD